MTNINQNIQKFIPVFLVGIGLILVFAVAMYSRYNNQDPRSLGYSGKPVPVEVSFPDITESTPSSTPSPQITKKMPLYLGFSFEPFDDQHIADMSKMVGDNQTIANTYLQWGNPGNSRFTPELFQVFTRRNMTPMITWEPWVPGAGVNQSEYSLAVISGGKYDDYIRQSANEIKKYGRPVFIRFAHEMNGDWYPWSGTVNGNTPSQYVATWKHVVDIFKSENVSNVTWVWCPNAGSYPAVPANDLSRYYPGDAYTDWVGLDGYNWGEYQGSQGWNSFDKIFGTSFTKMSKITSKSLMIAEVGSNELGGKKSDWMKEFLSPNLTQKYPQLGAIIYFNLKKEVDWRIQSSPESLKAFVESLGRQTIAKQVSTSNQKIIQSK